MSKNFISDETAKRMKQSISITENLSTRPKQNPRRRIRSTGGGTTAVLLLLKSYDEGEAIYTADIIDPTTEEVDTEDVKAALLSGVTNGGILVNTQAVSSLTKTVDEETIYIITAPIIY